MLSTVEKATCKKIDGHLTIDPHQICSSTWGSFAPFATAGFYNNNAYNYGCGCNGSTTV